MRGQPHSKASKLYSRRRQFRGNGDDSFLVRSCSPERGDSSAHHLPVFGARAREYLDDSVVTTKVKAELLRDPDVSGFAVNVETFKGIAQISGFVDNAAERRRAVEVTT